MVDFEIVYSNRTRHRQYGEREFRERQNPPSVTGYCEVYRVDGLWFGYRETDGGSMTTTGLATRRQAETQLREWVKISLGFWIEKLNWKDAGDVTPDGDPVMRVNGEHYVVGKMASDRALSCGAAGFGGQTFRFRRLDDPSHTYTTNNCWHQGVIPKEYRELLPDNAEFVKVETPRLQLNLGPFE